MGTKLAVRCVCNETTMKQTIGFDGFIDAFAKSDTYKDHFTFAGKRALFDYLEGLQEDLGEVFELDIVALCCDYVEHDSAWDAMKEYQPEDMPTPDVEEGADLLEVQAANEKAAHEWLEEETTVIDVEGGRVIIQAF